MLLRELFQNPVKYSDQNITVEGWIRTQRNSKTFGFIELNDGTHYNNLQIVYDDTLENFDEISKLYISTALRVSGKLLHTPDAKQKFELRPESIYIEGESTPDYPLQKKRHTFEYLRSIGHLRLRSNTFSAVFRVRSEAAFAIHKFFNDRGFVYANTPLITAHDGEGAGEMFKVTTLDLENIPLTPEGKVDFSEDFFGKATNLTVTGQLEGEAFAQAFRNIYTFGPTFRAENSNTKRHAAEFWMIEPEMAFADLEHNMEIAEAMTKFVIKHVMEKCPDEIKFFDERIENGLIDKLNNVVNSDFARITYTEAIEHLKQANDTFEYKVSWGMDIQTEHERYLAESVFGRPVFVTDYPKEIKAFYMKLNDDGKTVRAMDLLVPGIGELIGGSQREDRLEVLRQKIKDFGLCEDDYWWYLELRKYGSTTHSGYGLGFERLLMYITGMGNIRDVIPFARTPKSAEF